MNGAGQKIDVIAMVGNIQNGINDALGDVKKILTQIGNEQRQMISVIEKYREKYGDLEKEPVPTEPPVPPVPPVNHPAALPPAKRKNLKKK